MKKKLSERKSGVALEDLDSKLDLLLEGQSGLARRMDLLEVKVENLILRLDNLEKEMNYKFEKVFEELHLIRNNLKEKVSRDEFVALEKKVLMLERKLIGKK